ncbi:hypothetical protein Tco_1318946 [Tanacetum coccineum]
MTSLKFTKTHNLVAFLEKPKESNGFEGIINFLNASSIKYALTVNLTVYESCIEQFWITAKVKTINGECQIQAIVDKKKAIITEKSIMSDLKLDDAEEIAKLKERIKKLEKKRRSRIYKYKRLYKVGSSRRVESSEESLDAQEDAFNQGRKITAIDQDTEVTLVNETGERNDEEMLFKVDDNLQGEEVVIEEVAKKEISIADLVTTVGEVVTTASIEVTTASALTTTIDELTMAQTLIEIKAAKQPSETTTTKTITTAQPSSKDKGEGKMVEPEKPLKKKYQIALDEEYAFRLHAEEQAESERVQRERDAQEEASRAAVIEELDNIQAMI